jgi:hypothetical protein
VRRRQTLLVWLVLASAAQIAVTLAHVFIGRDADLIAYFEPRFTLFLLEALARGSEDFVPILGPVIALLTGFGAHRIAWRSTPRIIYLVFEITYVVVTLFCFLAIFLADMSPAHGLSPGELLLPAIALIVFSVVPASLALSLAVSDRRPSTTMPPR